MSQNNNTNRNQDNNESIEHQTRPQSSRTSSSSSSRAVARRQILEILDRTMSLSDATTTTEADPSTTGANILGNSDVVVDQGGDRVSPSSSRAHDSSVSRAAAAASDRPSESAGGLPSPSEIANILNALERNQETQKNNNNGGQ